MVTSINQNENHDHGCLNIYVLTYLYGYSVGPYTYNIEIVFREHSAFASVGIEPIAPFEDAYGVELTNTTDNSLVESSFKVESKL